MDSRPIVTIGGRFLFTNRVYSPQREYFMLRMNHSVQIYFIPFIIHYPFFSINSAGFSYSRYGMQIFTMTPNRTNMQRSMASMWRDQNTQYVRGKDRRTRSSTRRVDHITPGMKRSTLNLYHRAGLVAMTDKPPNNPRRLGNPYRYPNQNELRSKSPASTLYHLPIIASIKREPAYRSIYPQSKINKSIAIIKVNRTILLANTALKNFFLGMKSDFFSDCGSDVSFSIFFPSRAANSYFLP